MIGAEVEVKETKNEKNLMYPCCLDDGENHVRRMWIASKVENGSQLTISKEMGTSVLQI